MCGLFGVIYKKKKELMKIPLISLGRDNISRGKDSCGLVIDNQVEFGYDRTKNFNNFFKESKLLKEVKECKFVLGHTRAASSGLKVGLQQAQPICIYNGTKLDFVLTHNGTIEDKAHDLAKKYLPGIDVGDNTDSWIMAHIFYHHGYDVLKEYKGFGVFIIADYREAEPKILMFKGASKKNADDETLYEERPLSLTIEEDAIWYSSEPEPLLAARYGENVKRLASNTLYEITDDLRFKVVGRYDRSWYIQNGTSYTNTWYYDNRNVSNSKYNSTTYYSDKTPGKLATPIYTCKDKITYNSVGLYTLDKEIVTGIYSLDNIGYKATNYSITKRDYAFWGGRLLMSTKDYDLLEKICTELGIEKTDFTLWYPEVLDYISYLPTCFIDEENNQLFISQKTLEESVVFTGVMKPMFAAGTTYKINEGYIKSKTDYEADYLATYKSACKAWEDIIDKDLLKQEIITFISNAEKKSQ